MREPDRDKGRIEDMIEASNNVISFVDGLSFIDFSKDKLRYYAVLKNVEIIGEAAYMLTKDFRDSVNSMGCGNQDEAYPCAWIRLSPS